MIWDQSFSDGQEGITSRDIQFREDGNGGKQSDHLRIVGQGREIGVSRLSKLATGTDFSRILQYEWPRIDGVS